MCYTLSDHIQVLRTLKNILSNIMLEEHTLSSKSIQIYSMREYTYYISTYASLHFFNIFVRF